MTFNNCENVWRVVNDDVETMFIICIRPFIEINNTNNTFNLSNYANSSDIRSNISVINNTIILLDNSPSPTNHFSIYSPSPFEPMSPSSIIPGLISDISPSVAPSVVPSVAPSVAPSVFDNNDKIIKNISEFLNNSFNLTSNFSLSNYTNPHINKNKDQLIVVLSILIPLWFIFSFVTLYLYCKKRKSGAVIPCQNPSKKKDNLNKPRDYLLEIIPNTDIPDIEKPTPPVPPRPTLMILKESIEDEEEEVEIINVAYKITEKKVE